MKQSPIKNKGQSKIAFTKAAKKDSHKNSKGNENFFRWIIVAGILILTIIVFYPMLKNQFTAWDDDGYITSNVHIKNLDASQLKYIFTNPVANNYHPFTIISLAINYSISELNPVSYYFTNLLLHLLNVALVFIFIFYLSRRNIHVATFTALIFAIHPMHVESVAWASERKDVLYALFFISALITYLFYVKTKKPLFYFLTLLLAICSMFSKPAAIIFPMLLPLIDYYFDEKFSFQSVLKKAPFFLISIIFLYLTWISQTQDKAVIADFITYNPFQRFLFACSGFLIYIVKLYVPFQLAAFHPYPEKMGLLIYISPLVLIAMGAGIYFLKQHRKLLILGFGFYLINLILVLQFVSIGKAFYAERYTYIPYLGLLFIAGMLMFDNKFNSSKKLVWSFVAIISIAFVYVAHERVKVWHDGETLWTDMIDKYPNDSKGYYNRGIHYSLNNNYQKALADFSLGVKIKPDEKLYTNRAIAYSKLNMNEQALSDFNNSIKLNNKNAEVFIGRAQLQLELKHFDEALSDINNALEIKPTYNGYFTRASIYVDRNMFAEAVVDYNSILKENRDDVNAISNRGAAYFQLNKLDLAISDFSRAIELQPTTARHYANRSFAYNKKGDSQNAMLDTEKAKQLGYDFKRGY